MKTKKQQLRCHMQELALQVDAASRAHETSDLLHQLRSHHAWKKAATVLLYSPLLDEPDLLSLLTEDKNQRQFLFPRIHEKKLHLHAWYPSATWQKGPFGINEPDAEEWPLVALHEVELALVPGVAFDPQGNRLGRGLGFFDRLLSQPECRAIKIGVGWSWQLVPHVPYEHFDVRMDEVVTAFDIHKDRKMINDSQR